MFMLLHISLEIPLGTVLQFDRITRVRTREAELHLRSM